MPRNSKAPIKIEELSVEDRKAYKYQYQEHWYLLASKLCCQRTVLDVGSGTGYGLPFYWAAGATDVLGIDLLPADPMVQKVPLEHIRSDGFDVVTCFDVIEHVEDDHAFLAEILRVARYFALITTPNWDAWKCANPYHIREYTPAELMCLIKGGPPNLMWTCGKDRIASPVRPIEVSGAAEASFGILLRGSECSDEVWKGISDAHKTLHEGIPGKLSNITKSVEEWLSMARAVSADAADPLSAALKLLTWLQGVLCYPPATKELAELTDTAAILRYGLGSPMQQARSIAWILNTLVIGPTGPRINHPPGVPLIDAPH